MKGIVVFFLGGMKLEVGGLLKEEGLKLHGYRVRGACYQYHNDNAISAK